MKYKKLRALPKLKETLVKRGISQWRLSQAIDCTESATHRIINRKGGSPRTVKAIAKYLDMSQDELFEVVA